MALRRSFCGTFKGLNVARFGLDWLLEGHFMGRLKPKPGQIWSPMDLRKSFCGMFKGLNHARSDLYWILEGHFVGCLKS